MADQGASFHRLGALAFLSGLCATQTGPIVRACLQNVVAPRARATAFAIFAIFDDLGKGGGPWIIAKLVAVYGRRRAFVGATIVGWGVGGLVNWTVALTLDADERRLKDIAANDAQAFEAVDQDQVVIELPPIKSIVHCTGDDAPDDDSDAVLSALHRRITP